jgi:Protein O-mannosyl-transferase TMEM260-like
MDSVWTTFRRWNNITGWFVFLFSAVVYLLTVEPTVSFWDCGEFILSGFRLQVGHPPGAPLFLMMARVATFFAGGDASKAAVMVNRLSALCSACAIMFLFWTITHLVRRIFTRNNSLESRHIPAIIGSGLTGALAYTFSDTFWFSAVEGELYALSSLCLGLVFWAMLKWEEEADEPSAGRWIVLIAYMMGLGLGIHRLNLLVLPVLVFVFYFRKYEVTRKGVIYAVLLAFIILGFMVFILMPGIPEVAGWFELFFVNVLGMPYNSGLLIFLVALAALLVFGIRYSLKQKRVVLNYILTCLTVIMIGYSSYAMIMIRSSAKPPMNQNNPSDIFSLAYYINMQQYGSSPKIYGPYYNAPAVSAKKVIGGYNKVNGKYVPYYHPEYDYNNKFMTVFPRMYSQDPEHEDAYKHWARIKGRKYSYNTGTGRETIVCPTFVENLRFFFRYQTGFMYMRYFMWNFVGRQNDIQGNGNKINGNWISGIKFVDEARLGRSDSLPDDLKDNPANNKYYFLPLLLGIAGIFWQYKRDKRGFWLILAFFLMTGLAIILYLNQSPNQPRERDYAYAGSFYAFAVWIGIGFMFIYELIRRFLNHKVAAVITFLVVMAACPLLMAVENWDDHDRSGRYTARDIGSDYLESCAPNSILFTYGDNDSFPVWYVQDVEGIRTDIRVANLSYIQAGWYIDMMKQKAFESDPMPLTLGSDKYLDGIRTQLPVNKRIQAPVSLSEIVQFAGMDDKKYMIDYSGQGDYLNYLPANKFIIDVDTAEVLANGTVKKYFKDRIVSPMIWEYTDEDAFKGDLAIMDLLSTNKWKRPVYFSTTVPSSQYKGLQKYFVQEGMAYRIVPIRTDESEQGEFGMIDRHVMYDNMMHRFKWGNAADPSVYLDENNRRMFSNFRRIFGNLAREFIQAGDTVKAVEVANKGLSIVPSEKMPDDFFSVGLAETLIRAGKKDEGDKLISNIINYSKEYLDYTINLRPDQRYGLDYPTGINMQALLDIYHLSVNLDDEALRSRIEPMMNLYYGRLYSGK